MKTLFASLLIAFTVGTSSITLAAGHPSAPGSDPQPVQAVVIPKLKGMKLDVIVDANEHSAVTVRFLNDQGGILVKRRISKSDTPTLLRFDLSQLADGQYTVAISDGSNTQLQEVNLQTPASLRTISLQ
jgi:hypothetical protein